MKTLPHITEFTELIGEMPLERIIEALDDDGDGIADAAVWQAVRDAAAGRVTAACGTAETAAALPAATIAHAARAFILEMIFNRRGYPGEGNPYAAAAARAENNLRALAETTKAAADESAAEFIGKPARINQFGGLLP